MAGEELDLVLRVALPADADAVAELYALTRRAAVPQMPAAVHSEQQDREFFAGLIAGEAEVWVAESPGTFAPVGFAALQSDWLHSLYVRPGWTGQGVGSSLLELVKALRPSGFALWVFESNARARSFYADRGLVVVRRTDGSGNEEKAADLQMMWPGDDPVAALREAIDENDRELARLLELRAGLTAEIQAHKSAGGGPAPRDPGREAAIIANMAPFAPRLGRDRLASIMHAVIGESLAAVAEAPGSDAEE
jgi:chorismate mutase/GNAT superfamily N-acetyltransferase